MRPTAPSANRVRQQLTLFVPPSHRQRFENVRRTLDPVQTRLIAAHVTLCREDELDQTALATVDARLRERAPAAITLTFGAPERFGDHGILLPCLAGEDAYHELRCAVLGSAEAGRRRPHITLAHPRNPRGAGNQSSNWPAHLAGTSVIFDTASLIRQVGGQPWEHVTSYGLGTDP